MKKLLLAGIAAAVAVPVLAQPAAPVRPMADGSMTRVEMQTMIANMFARLDTNRDGAITSAEADAARATMRAKRMEHRGDMKGRMGDGVMRQRDPGAMFDRIDTNRDGMISRDEFAKGHEMRIERRVVRKVDAHRDGHPVGQHDMGMGMNGMAMRGGMMMMGSQMFEQADTNRDGRLTMAEANAMADRHFAMMDSNRDGRVTRDEMRAMHQQMRGRMQKAD